MDWLKKNLLQISVTYLHIFILSTVQLNALHMQNQPEILFEKTNNITNFQNNFKKKIVE